MTKLYELANIGQSIWYDNIRRALLDSGEMQTLIDQGVTGVTSNPSIFEKAIAGSTDYDEALSQLVEEDKSAEEIYEILAIQDIQRTADLLSPIYGRTEGMDGYVSLEVSPTLAHDTEGTIEEARRLFHQLNRPNVMIKVPATPAGISAIETLIGEGINVNVTLIFALSNYEAVAEAYIKGLEKLAEKDGDLSKVASVASFFVSRVDSAVDRELEAMDDKELLGKIAIANAKVAKSRFREIFSGERWERLAQEGARVQRPLWASTSTKNPSYPDTLYVDALIGPQTVNTIPPSTLKAYLDHGVVSRTLDVDLDKAQAQLKRLAEIGVDLDGITEKLQDDGVEAFAKSFQALLSSVAEKRDRFLRGWEHQSETLGKYQSVVDEALAELAQEKVLSRIWAHDHTVWKPEPAEISNRLGWLHSSDVMIDNLHRLTSLVQSVQEDGYTQALLLGMGGSSLAPEVFRKTFGVEPGYLDLAVLDSTDPGAILAQAQKIDLGKTLFVVATKSGGTVETLSFFKYFYNEALSALGENEAGQHFIAITDPGSSLAALAETYKFRATFLNDPNIGGRYSALSYFGLVPAALLGVDVPLLLDRGLTTACGTEPCVTVGENPGARLGAIMGELAKAGRDKVTLVLSPQIESFGSWVEQLIAESTGKEGKGILPVVGEPLGPPEVYGEDRLFIHIKIRGDETHDKALAELELSGHPVVRIHLQDRYDLGGQFFQWEMATAIAGERLGINPFDQPNVESAKALAKEMVAEYTEKGGLPEADSAPLSPERLESFLSEAGQGAYVALQAYVQPTAEIEDALHQLRKAIRDHTRFASTVGFGPRFLHSTGQLHKGDAGKGLFIQFTSDDHFDVPIPKAAGSSESALTFGVLKAAQAMGDQQALLNRGRKVIRFHLDRDVLSGIQLLTRSLT
jgi:transaldolase/glucose-6-phosphate isomerase